MRETIRATTIFTDEGPGLRLLDDKAYRTLSESIPVPTTPRERYIVEEIKSDIFSRGFKENKGFSPFHRSFSGVVIKHRELEILFPGGIPFDLTP